LALLTWFGTVSIQRAILLDPGSSDATRNIDAAESAELIANLRMQVATLNKDLSSIQQRLRENERERESDVSYWACFRICFDRIVQRLTLTSQRTKAQEELESTRASFQSREDASASRLSANEELLSTLNSQFIIAKTENEELQNKLTLSENEAKQLKKELAATSSHSQSLAELESLSEGLKIQLAEAQSKQTESEKEQEDLLVLLEEISSKRKADKVKMKGAGIEISDDDEEEEEDDDEEAK